MIGDNRREIIGRGLFLKNRCGVRDVIEQRPVGEERASRHEHDPCIRVAIAGEIGDGKGAAVFQHDVQHDDVGRIVAQIVDGLSLAAHDNRRFAMTLNVARPDSR